jgi:hypothetical protein
MIDGVGRVLRRLKPVSLLAFAARLEVAPFQSRFGLSFSATSEAAGTAALLSRSV